MRALRVPKQRTTIHVTLLDGASLDAAVFLAEHAETHPGPERLSEWLEDGPSFLPAVELASDRVMWLNRETMMVVRSSVEADYDEAVANTIPTEQEVNVWLRDGSMVSGLAVYVMPDGHSRLTDFLNSTHPFLKLLHGTEVLFINKRHVVRVTLRGES